ncbi:MAG: quaternary amine ABC transporter ATP-binding protein [Actinomycetota bacterium]
MAAVSAEGLYKVFGRRPEEAVRMLEEGASREDVERLGAIPAVIDASFEVEPGEIFVVMGLSGSGKSTLIRMLNGLWAPTAGKVYIGDDLVSDLPPAQLRVLRSQRMSMVFQHFALLPHRTVLENAAYALNIQGRPKEEQDERAREALRLVGLEGWEERFPVQLSGGMKQRVGLARALASGTEIMLMDEAFSALDPLIRREMQDELVKLQASLSKTVVFITHDLNEAMRLGDRIAMMRSGRIEQIGTPEEVLQDPANDYVAQFTADVDRTRVLTASSVMEPAKSVVGAGVGPRVALREMRENQINAAFVVAPNGKLQGIVRDEDVVQAANRGDKTLDSILMRDVASVRQDTVLAELFAPSVESPLPLAVVNDDGNLVGVVPRVTLLSAMVTMGEQKPETPARAETSMSGSATPGEMPAPDENLEVETEKARSRRGTGAGGIG